MAPPYGGVSVFVKRLIERLSDDGFTVGGYYAEAKPMGQVKSAMFEKWTWFQTLYFPWKFFKYAFRLKDYRVLHSHMSLEAMVYLWAFRHILRKKIIITIHNSMVEQYYGYTNPINRFFLHRMVRDKDVVWIACSQEGKEQMERLPLHFASPIHVIPAYIPARASESDLSDSLQSYLRSHEKNLVFYGHSFMLHRGTDVYGFKAMLTLYSMLRKNNPQLGLVYCIAETTDMASIAQLQSLAGEDKEAIFWQLGGIANMASLWNQTDVYVRPTSTDGDSLSVREALEAGAQVVASDVVKRPSGTIVYRHGILEEAAEKIVSALSIPRQHPAQDYTYYQAMKNIYLELLS